ncbi:MAG: ROK family protein [Candidatus Methylacidiphilales bacterium]|nr:ROK family protein [Candidatus Methylacidiphilales bacterium]
MESYVVGVDMGGTMIKVASFDPAGRMLAQLSTPTGDGERMGDHPAWAVRVKKLVAEMETHAGGPASGIGMTCPGMAARDKRHIVSLPNRLHGLEGFDWTEWLGRKTPVPVLNDAHAALLGEAWQGAASGMEDVVMLTLGTGVGGAILSGGRLVRGHLGRAGEFGHTTVDYRGEPGNAGMRGDLESFIGNATLRRRSGDRFASTKALVQAHLAGDAEASRIWLDSIEALGCGIASLINAVDPEAVILGGGIAEAREALWVPLEAVLDRVEWRPRGQRVRILRAKLGDWAGTYGAAWEALHGDLAQMGKIRS